MYLSKEFAVHIACIPERDMCPSVLLVGIFDFGRASDKVIARSRCYDLLLIQDISQTWIH